MEPFELKDPDQKKWIDMKNYDPYSWYPPITNPPHPDKKEYEKQFKHSWDDGGSVQSWYEQKGNVLHGCRGLIRGDGKVFPDPNCHPCEGRIYSPYRATQVKKGNEIYLEGISRDGYFYKPNHTYSSTRDDVHPSLWQRFITKIW